MRRTARNEIEIIQGTTCFTYSLRSNSSRDSTVSGPPPTHERLDITTVPGSRIQPLAYCIAETGPFVAYAKAYVVYVHNTATGITVNFTLDLCTVAAILWNKEIVRVYTSTCNLYTFDANLTLLSLVNLQISFTEISGETGNNIINVVTSYHSKQDYIHFGIASSSLTAYTTEREVTSQLACRINDQILGPCDMHDREETVLDYSLGEDQIAKVLLEELPESLFADVEAPMEDIINELEQELLRRVLGPTNMEVDVKLHRLKLYQYQHNRMQWQETAAEESILRAIEDITGKISYILCTLIFKSLEPRDYTDQELKIISNFIVYLSKTEADFGFLSEDQKASLTDGTHECPVCETSIPFTSTYEASCEHNHIWPRCGRTLLVLDGPGALTCTACGVKYWNGEDVFKSEIRDCSFCGAPLKEGF